MASGIRGIRTWRDRWPTWRSPSAGSLCSCRKESTAKCSGDGRPLPVARSRQRQAARLQRRQDSRQHDYRGRLAQLRREALEHLEAARAIYQQRPNHHGAGTVYLNAAYIHLDSGDFQRAEEEAASAYEVAEEKQDYILMGRARILQCMIENAKVEEEIGEGADPGSHARRALEFSQEAIELAKHTQHHLLLANAHLWQGLTQCNSFFDNPEAARESYDLARASCGANQPDNNMWQDLQTLSAKILRKGSVASGAESVVAGCGGREDVPANQRRICGDRDRAGLGARRPQSVASGGAALDFSQESAAHPGAGGTAKAASALGKRHLAWAGKSSPGRVICITVI